MNNKDIFIDGGDIYLRAPKEKDLEGNWYSWLNDPVVTKYQDKGIKPQTKELQEKYYNYVMKSENDVIFAICDKKSEKHIGSVGLHKINWIHHSAELGIMIGEKEYWGKGYGKKVWNLISGYGFNVLNLHRIYAFIINKNISSVKSAKASGFKEVGIVKDMYYKNGKYYDAVMLNCLKDEYINLDTHKK